MLKMKTVYQDDGSVDWRVVISCDQCGGEIGSIPALYAWEVRHIGAVREDGSFSPSAYEVVTGEIVTLHRDCLFAWADSHGDLEHWVASDMRSLPVGIGEAVRLRVTVEGWNDESDESDGDGHGGGQ